MSRFRLSTMNSKIQVLHIIKNYRGNYPLLNHITDMDKERFQNHVCYLKAEDDGKNLIDQNGTQTYYLNVKGDLHPYRFSVAQKIADLVDSIHANCVISHLEKTIHLVALSTLFTKNHPSYIGVIHGVVGGKRLPLNKQFRNWLAFKRMHKIVSVSKSGITDILEHNWSLPTDKVVAIQNGIDPTGLSGMNDLNDENNLLPPEMDNCFKFGTVGRLAQKKNQILLLHAFSEVTKTNDNTRLIIIGTGPLEQELKSLADKLGIKDRVWFTGYRNDVPKLLSLIDVFVFPSLREGLPLSLLEAMALGRPCIASDLPCNREVIQSESVGRLVSPTQVNEWTDSMIEFYQLSTEDLSQIGQNAFHRVKAQFTFERMTHEYENLAQDLYNHNHS